MLVTVPDTFKPRICLFATSVAIIHRFIGIRARIVFDIPASFAFLVLQNLTGRTIKLSTGCGNVLRTAFTAYVVLLERWRFSHVYTSILLYNIAISTSSNYFKILHGVADGETPRIELAITEDKIASGQNRPG
jgi:hypothetical protein